MLNILVRTLYISPCHPVASLFQYRIHFDFLSHYRIGDADGHSVLDGELISLPRA
jgi:hypothetical protein